MDHFGIGAAMQGMARVYTQSARRSGRTRSLIESVKDGDRIVFADPREASRVDQLLKERGVKVTCIVLDPKAPESVFTRATSEGRTIFDHTWVEQYYLHAITQAQEQIDRLQKQSSGYGEAHRETRRAAIELSRWD